MCDSLRSSTLTLLAVQADWHNAEVSVDDNWPSEGHIKFNSYATRYRSGLDLVLDDISFDIRSGEKVSVCYWIVKYYLGFKRRCLLMKYWNLNFLRFDLSFVACTSDDFTVASYVLMRYINREQSHLRMAVNAANRKLTTRLWMDNFQCIAITVE